MKAALYFSVFSTICLSLLLLAGIFLLIKDPNGFSIDDELSFLPLFLISLFFSIGFKKRSKSVVIVNLIYFTTPFIVSKIFPDNYSVDFFFIHFTIAVIYLTIIIVNYKKLI